MALPVALAALAAAAAAVVTCRSLAELLEYFDVGFSCGFPDEVRALSNHRNSRCGHGSHAGFLVESRIFQATHEPKTRLPALGALGPVTPKKVGLCVLAVLLLGGIWSRIMRWFRTPKRPYTVSSVGASYDSWTREGVLEHYWGEHIHMGSYTPLSVQKGYSKRDPFFLALFRATLRSMKDFKLAKIDFTNEMIDWCGPENPKKILDVGCGIGGSSRILAARFPNAEVIGITLSPEQQARATAITKEQGLNNARFQVMNALAMEFPDNSFDMVWACESGEHMPDKKTYVEEMSRVLAPSGKMVVATWCERDPSPPFNKKERDMLEFLYAEWSHPFFISLNKYKEYLLGTGALDKVETADWTEQTLPSWRHSIWVGAWRPAFWLKIVMRRPLALLGFLREVYTLEQYHRSMVDGLMVYGMMKATKKSQKESLHDTVAKPRK